MSAFVNKYPWLLNIIPTEVRNQVRNSLKKSDKDIIDLLTKFCEQYGYKEIGYGSFRQVYDTGIGWVIKFPTDFEGIECNLIEANIYETFKNTGHYAKCYIKLYHGIPLLVMETVTNYFAMEDAPPMGLLPDWVHHSDGPQIGYTDKGKLRIYDYGACFYDKLLPWRELNMARKNRLTWKKR